MKKKQTKSVLTIKENWSKNLTLSSTELLNVRKGGGASKKNCTGCGPGGETYDTKDFGCPDTQ